jgi:hypothetical protein
MAYPNTNPTYQYIGGESEDGVIVGISSSRKLSFYGTTPAVVKPSGAAQAAVATGAATTGSAIYGFTSAQANGIITLLNQIRSDLVTLGLIKGS